MQIIKVEGGQLATAPLCLSCGLGLFIFTKREHSGHKAGATGELYRELSCMVAHIGRLWRCGNGVLYLLYSFQGSRTAEIVSIAYYWLAPHFTASVSICKAVPSATKRFSWSGFFPTCCEYCGGKKSSPRLFVPTHCFTVYSVRTRCLHCAPVWSLMFHLFILCIRIPVSTQSEVVEWLREWELWSQMDMNVRVLIFLVWKLQALLLLSSVLIASSAALLNRGSPLYF